MFNLRFAVFSTCIASLMSFPAAVVAAPAAGARDGEISAILDQQKPDPARLERNRAAADVQPPAGGQLGQFYYRRAQARAALGRNEEAIADLQEALKHGRDLSTEIARYSQLMAQQYRVVGKIKSAIDAELALAKKVEAAPRGKGLLFGIYLRTEISYLTLGDLKQAEVYLNKNLALLAESRKWPNVDAFRSSWEANVENGRARLLMRQGKYREAEVGFHKTQGLLRDALAKSANWPNKPPADLMEASIDFATMQEGEAKSKQGRLREAEADVRRALLSRLKTVGKYHPDTAQVTLSLSHLMTEQSQFADAEELARTSVEIYRTLGYPEEVAAHAFALNQLASTLFSQRKWEEAAEIYDRIDAATERWEPTRAARLRLGYSRIFTSYGTKRVDQGIEGRGLLLARQLRGRPERHDRAVVHRVVEDRAGEHETVDDRHGHAGGCSAGERAHHPAPAGAMEQEPVAVPRVRHRDHERLAIVHEPHVRDPARVEDRVHDLTVVDPAVRDSSDGRSAGRHRDWRVSGSRPRRQSSPRAYSS